MISPAKFLSDNPNLMEYSNKYLIARNGDIIPNEDSVILSFIYMLVNALSGVNNSHKWTKEEYYCYLDFLQSQKIDKELLDFLSRIYVDFPKNIFDKDLLETINVKKDYRLLRTRG